MRRKKSKPSMTTFPTATTLAGQRRQVYEGRALKTKGGLFKKDLIESKSTGRIVSKVKSRQSKKQHSANGLGAYQF